MTEAAITKNRIISELTKSPHGKLTEYMPIGIRAAVEEPEFYAHLISWNRVSGQVRDSKVALPVITMAAGRPDPEYLDNALAHLATLDPRNLLRAIRFGEELKMRNWTRNKLKKMVARYLRARESKPAWWDKTAVQHRGTLKELYSIFKVKPSPRAKAILFEGQFLPDSTFAVIKSLKDMKPAEAAGQILERKIPFLIARGALGEKAKDPDLVLALIERMSPTELVTNSKWLSKLGINSDPALRAAYQEALKKAEPGKANVFKTSVAAEAVEDETIKARLHDLQERQLKTMGVEGDWLIIADKSGSMQQSIQAGVEIAAVLAKLAMGHVYLVFVDSSPRYIDATNKTLEQLRKETRGITANGGTSLGCGLQLALDQGWSVDGIVVVSDGGENHIPMFAPTYKEYKRKHDDKSLPVYLYLLPGEPNMLAYNMQAGNLDLQMFDLRGGKTDFYALPNLVKTMRCQRYDIYQEILDTPLLTLDAVLQDAKIHAASAAH